MTVVATVGSTHPLAFAGLPFALLALEEEGVRPVCVVAGVTAQDAAHVRTVRALDAGVIGAQFEALAGANVAAFHVGALLSAEAVHAVAEGLARFEGIPAVVDPVLAASGGDTLADEATVRALRETLIPRAALVTPNLHEAATLLGRPVQDAGAMEAAARAFVEMGAAAALVKGGHLDGDPVDVFADARGVRRLHGPRIEATLRGTGDLLAATVAACLASGAEPVEAIERARRRVREAIARGTMFAGTRVAVFHAR